VAERLLGYDYRSGAVRSRDGLGRLVVGSVRWGCAGREGPRRRADGRRAQGLGSGARVGGFFMSATVEVVESVEPCTIVTSSLCLDLAQQAKLASRQLAVARGSAKHAWLERSAAALVARRDEILA